MSQKLQIIRGDAKLITTLLSNMLYLLIFSAKTSNVLKIDVCSEITQDVSVIFLIMATFTHVATE